MFRVAPYQRKEDPKYDKLKEFIVHYNHADTFLPVYRRPACTGWFTQLHNDSLGMHHGHQNGR